MVLDDCLFFFFHIQWFHPIQVGEKGGAEQATTFCCSYSHTATVKLGVAGQNGTQQNTQTTSSFFTILSPTEGPLPHT